MPESKSIAILQFFRESFDFDIQDPGKKPFSIINYKTLCEQRQCNLPWSTVFLDNGRSTIDDHVSKGTNFYWLWHITTCFRSLSRGTVVGVRLQRMVRAVRKI